MGKLSRFIYYYSGEPEEHTRTVSGDKVSFVSPREWALKSLKVGMEPIQDVSGGEPSPENICSIIGWTSTVAVVSPTADSQDGTEYTANWESDPGTVFGGEYDFVTGLLSEQWAEVDIATVDIELNGHVTEDVDEILLKPGNMYPEDMDSNMMSNVFTNGTVTTPYTYMYSGRYGIYLHLPTLETYTEDGARAALQALETQIVYRTKVPVTHQLTPQEVMALEGQNYVWSDTGNVSVTYKS